MAERADFDSEDDYQDWLGEYGHLSAGRCEDAPCCNHGTEGCTPSAEGTSEHWFGIIDRIGIDRYDELDQMGAWDE